MITIVLAIVALVTIFSVQNASPIVVSFLFWQFEASLAIVIFLSVLSGILIAVGIEIPFPHRTIYMREEREWKP